MKRPTWATVVGVLGIIFGCFGILGSGQNILMPQMMEMQKEMMTAFQEEIEKQAEREQERSEEGGNNENQAAGFPIKIFESMQKMWDMPEWFKTWSVVTGVIKLLISSSLLYVSICMLQLKQNSIKLFYYVTGTNIAFVLVSGLVALSVNSFMGVAMMTGGIFSIGIDIVLLIVVINANKESFYQPEGAMA